MTAATLNWLDFNDVIEPVTHPAHERDEVRSRLLDRLDTALPHLLPAGKRQGHNFVVGNLNGEPGNSLVVETQGPRRGLWHDFATGDKGDILDLWAHAQGFSITGEFGLLLEDVAHWLGMPASTPSISKPHPSGVAYDELGAHTGKWDYHSADGKLLACVYRYDTQNGKEYRPWDARARLQRMPDPRPLYNLPGISRSQTVVLVEGEKCADALSQLGITATTAMGGALTALDKTDWSPLAGKTVIVWPDNDVAGAHYADAVIPKLQEVGAREVRRLSIPNDKPGKWDAADAVREDEDIAALLASAKIEGQHRRNVIELADWRAIDRFAGSPKPRRWLVEGVFPLAQPALVAAGGGIGKSFLLLELARQVAGFSNAWAYAPMLFGGKLSSRGTAVYITAEDDAIEVHNRLNTLGAIPSQLYVVPLPDAGGATPLFAPDPATRGPATTSAWASLQQQLIEMRDLKLIVLDPLQPLCALDLNVPENAQFVCTRLSALGAATGAAIIVSHHFAKREASTPEQAREAIRGTGGLVDGMRSVFALWNPKEDRARQISQTLDVPYQRGNVVCGGIVKANGRANLQVTTYVRDQHGLLVDRSNDLDQGKIPERHLLPELTAAIARAARDGIPYTKTGINGVFERRHELPEAFHAIGKHKFADWITALLANGSLISAMVENSKIAKWLDVPEGPLARGEANFKPGHIRRSQPGRG